MQHLDAKDDDTNLLVVSMLTMTKLMVAYGFFWNEHTVHSMISILINIIGKLHCLLKDYQLHIGCMSNVQLWRLGFLSCQMLLVCPKGRKSTQRSMKFRLCEQNIVYFHLYTYIYIYIYIYWRNMLYITNELVMRSN